MGCGGKHSADGPPETTQDFGASPRSRAFSVGASSAGPPSVSLEPLGSSRRTPGRAHGRARWIRRCIVWEGLAMAPAPGDMPTTGPTVTGGRKAAGQRRAGPHSCADTQARDWVRRTQDAAAGNEKGKRGRGLGHPPRLRLPPEDARRIAPSHIEPGSGQCLVDIGVVARRQLGHRQGTLASVLGVRCAEAPLGIDRSPTGRVALGRWNVTLAMTEGRPAPVGWRGNTACER